MAALTTLKPEHSESAYHMVGVFRSIFRNFLNEFLKRFLNAIASALEFCHSGAQNHHIKSEVIRDQRKMSVEIPFSSKLSRLILIMLENAAPYLRRSFKRLGANVMLE